LQPNPFSQTTQLTYQLKTNDIISITIYNIYGQEVQSISKGEAKSAGYYSYIIDRKNLAEGVYFIQLATQDTTIIQKVVLQ
jgi:serine protease AprX